MSEDRLPMMLSVRVDALTRGNITVPRMPFAKPDLMGRICLKTRSGVLKIMLMAMPKPKMIMPGRS
jgi:hypothetical protein